MFEKKMWSVFDLILLYSIYRVGTIIGAIIYKAVIG